MELSLDCPGMEFCRHEPEVFYDQWVGAEPRQPQADFRLTAQVSGVHGSPPCSVCRVSNSECRHWFRTGTNFSQPPEKGFVSEQGWQNHAVVSSIDQVPARPTRFWPSVAILAPNRRANTVIYSQIPYATEQGFFFHGAANFWSELGGSGKPRS